MTFEEKLKELRQKSGLNQNQTAEAVGITLRQYQRFEKGEQRPGYDNLIKIADHFDVSLDWLMGRSDRH